MSRLRDLSALLRDEASWPPGFEWYFGDTNSCAIGLARATGLLPGPRLTPCRVSEARHLGLPKKAFMDLFFDYPDHVGSTLASWVSVKPEMVADRIDAYLATVPAKKAAEPKPPIVTVQEARRRMAAAA